MDGEDPQLEKNTLHQQLEQLREEKQRLLQLEQDVIGYVRAKIDQLLKIMGTLPLRPEELDDTTLLALDPIGIIAESFSQVLEHLKETNNDLVVARDELKAIFNATGAAIIVLDDALKLHSCNPMAVTRFGVDTENALGRHLEEVIPDCYALLSKHFLDELAGCRQGKRVVEIAFGDFWYSLVATPVCNSNDQVSFYVRVKYIGNRKVHLHGLHIEADIAVAIRCYVTHVEVTKFDICKVHIPLCVTGLLQPYFFSLEQTRDVNPVLQVINDAIVIDQANIEMGRIVQLRQLLRHVFR